MADKKSPGRFTLKFNIEDPKQLAAISILNRQGRTKAQFIADAVLHYMNCPESPAIERLPPQMDEERIKQIVYSLLREQTHPKDQVLTPEAQGGAVSEKSTQATLTMDGDGPFDEKQLAAIAKTMASFN